MAVQPVVQVGHRMRDVARVELRERAVVVCAVADADAGDAGALERLLGLRVPAIVRWPRRTLGEVPAGK